MLKFYKKIFGIILITISICCLLYCSSGTEPSVDPLVLSFETANASYMEANDGSIDLTVSGGTSPFSYLWSTGATSEDLDQLSAGVYKVTVTDSEGQHKTDSIQITQPNNIGRVTDIDGNIYKTIKIGEQWWMAENLNVIHNSRGEEITSCVYNDDATNENTYGRLYTWDSAMDSTQYSGGRGIAPEGWHIPTTAEWQELATYLGGLTIAGGKMKQVGQSLWLSPNTGATNSSKFNALPGGEKEGSRYQFKGQIAIFWSSVSQHEKAFYYYLSNDNAEMKKLLWNKDLWYSIRCIKD